MSLDESWNPYLYSGVMPAWFLFRFVVRIKNEDAHESALTTVDFYAVKVASCYRLNSVPSSPNYYVEGLILNVTEFGDGSFK